MYKNDSMIVYHIFTNGSDVINGPLESGASEAMYRSNQGVKLYV